jgi:hypothetical protein
MQVLLISTRHRSREKRETKREKSVFAHIDTWLSHASSYLTPARTRARTHARTRPHAHARTRRFASSSQSTRDRADSAVGRNSYRTARSGRTARLGPVTRARRQPRQKGKSQAWPTPRVVGCASTPSCGLPVSRAAQGDLRSCLAMSHGLGLEQGAQEGVLLSLRTEEAWPAPCAPYPFSVRSRRPGHRAASCRPGRIAPTRQLQWQHTMDSLSLHLASYHAACCRATRSLVPSASSSLVQSEREQSTKAVPKAMASSGEA